VAFPFWLFFFFFFFGPFPFQFTTVFSVRQYGYRGSSNAKVIAKECGWATLSPLYEGLKVLCNHGAIRKLSRGMYQINPSYAGKGAWRYNKKERQGGIENIITTFRVRGKSVDTVIEWDEN